MAYTATLHYHVPMKGEQTGRFVDPEKVLAHAQRLGDGGCLVARTCNLVGGQPVWSRRWSPSRGFGGGRPNGHDRPISVSLTVSSRNTTAFPRPEEGEPEARAGHKPVVTRTTNFYQETDPPG